MTSAMLSWPTLRARLDAWSQHIKREGLTLWFAMRDPATPRVARVLLMIVVGYALSPIDLIPDFVPLFGYLDDALLLPGLIWIALQLIPAPVLEANRARAQAWLEERREKPHSHVGTVLVVATWIGSALLVAWWLMPRH